MPFPRLVAALLLALAAAAPLRAASQARGPASPAPHPLLLGSPGAPLELGGLSYGGWGARLLDGGRPVPRLGRGEFGMVDEHPRVPGAVIKTVNVSPEAELLWLALGLPSPTPDRVAAKEESVARRLAEAGAGPRYLGTGSIQGVPVGVRERVYGETVARAIAARRFGPRERELVEAMLLRLARAGLMPSDPKPANIMLGRTWRDEADAAYLVDGGSLAPLPADLGEEGALRALLEAPALVGVVRYDPAVGLVVPAEPLGRILDAGLRRSRTPPPLERLKSWLGLGGPRRP